MSLATGGLIQINDGDGNVAPAQKPTSFETPLTGNQTPFGRDDYRME